MGIYDVPAVLDYVTNVTGHNKVHYISFSLGSTAFFAGLSKMPEYNDKIGLGIAIGPSTYQQVLVLWYLPKSVLLLVEVIGKVNEFYF